ncbi:glycosyltransferase [Roseospira visakhapatnamensis]|uniref:Glycosyltransferase involved in cell wall biosynthesis n=1 Tax=Roseospira visakhapatnamensis TaxID=390880 RepID=A0A7W6WAF3_9PROT|nr:glycosyltransferase [Roseospira visakhapatnamensis]MBB4266436.1 glycosyltransferase involved in cell wall biosynthesis [Roseospira visakhapatnamensis]
MSRPLILGRDIHHRPGDPRDWALRLPPGNRLEAPGEERSLTASVLWAALRQGVRTVAVRDAGGGWRETTPAVLLLARLRRRLAAVAPEAADRAWARVLATPLPPAGRAEGPLVLALPSLAGNGAERQALALIAGLRARGWPVHVLVKHLHDRPGAAALRPDVERLGVLVHVWTDPPPQDTPALAALERATAGLPDALAADLLGLAGWIAALRPRAVHGWLEGTAILAATAAAVLGVPRAVAGLRNLAPDRMAHPLARALRPGLTRLSGHPAVTVTGNSRAVAEDHVRWTGITPPMVLPNGVAPMPPGPPHPDRPPLVLGVFRLVAHKRPLLWLEAAARVRAARPEVRFRLLGDGPLAEAITAHARALGVPLEHPGWVTDVTPYWAEAAVLLHVSAAEGLPNAILEALAAGVPVVAAPAGGVAEALGHPPVTPPTPEALAAQVVTLLDDPARRETLADAGRSRARRFSVAAMVARHERLYDTPPASSPEDRRHALAARLRPSGLARSLGTLGRLALAGEGHEIAARIAGLIARPARPRAARKPTAAPPPTIAAVPPNSPRLAWVGETLDRDGAPLSLRDLVAGLTMRGAVTPSVGLVLRDGPLRATWTAAGWPLRVVPGHPPLTAGALDRHTDTLAQALTGARAEAVLVNGLRAFAGVEAAARAGRPCLWVIREPGPEALADLSRSVQARALDAFALAGRVVFVSGATAAAWAPWCPAARAMVIPNALPPLSAPGPDRAAVRAALGWPADAWGVLATGTLCPRKDPLTLIAALPLLPDALQARLRVVWAGRDEAGYAHRARRAIRDLPEPLRAAVALAGEHADLSPLWAAADVAVCVSRAEAAPRVVLEARRAGLPLVATAVGGVADQAASWPSTWLVPPADPPALARALTAAWHAGRRPTPPGDEAARFRALVRAYAAALRAPGIAP